MLLQFGADGEAFAGEKRRDPFGGPGALAGFVDARQGLERNGFGDLFGECASQVVPVAAHCEGGGTNGAAKIESKI